MLEFQLCGANVLRTAWDVANRCGGRLEVQWLHYVIYHFFSLRSVTTHPRAHRKWTKLRQYEYIWLYVYMYIYTIHVTHYVYCNSPLVRMENVGKSEVGPSGIKVQMSKKFQQKPSNATTCVPATSGTKMLAESPIGTSRWKKGDTSCWSFRHREFPYRPKSKGGSCTHRSKLKTAALLHRWIDPNALSVTSTFRFANPLRVTPVAGQVEKYLQRLTYSARGFFQACTFLRGSWFPKRSKHKYNIYNYNSCDTCYMNF